MAKMNLNEEEASVIRKEFGDFLSGNSTETGVLYAACETTMHTDTHNDVHTDFGS